VIRAVVFDLDGVLLDSEPLWDEARREVVAEHHGRWRDEATATMQGMSSREWSRYMCDELGAALACDQIVDQVVEKLLQRYRGGLPLVPGAKEVVVRIGRHWPLGLASSANREVIDEVLAVAGWQEAFRITVSSEEVAKGKPAPDVYLEAASQLRQQPRACAAIEDSANGVRAAVEAGLHAIVVPNREFQPSDRVLSGAAVVIDSLADLTPELVARAGGDGGPIPRPQAEEELDEEELESFPTSDPHSDWGGRSR
jgi:beta-phosphoglucomutase-like phosphatase (HAD superfamily)